MIEVLEFIFQDFLHFIGTALLLSIIFDEPFVKITKVFKETQNEDRKDD